MFVWFDKPWLTGLQCMYAYASSGFEVGLKSNESGYPESRIVITSDKFLFLLALKL